MKFPKLFKLLKLAKQKNRYNQVGSRISRDWINPEETTRVLRLGPRSSLVIGDCLQALIDTCGMTPLQGAIRR